MLITIIIHQIFSIDYEAHRSSQKLTRSSLEAHSFPRASLSENCSLLGTDNVQGQISEHIFAPNEGYCLFISKMK